MEFVDLVVDKCIERFEQERKSREEGPAADSRVDYGVPPGAMLIQFGKGILDRGKADFRQLTEIEKAWYYSDGTLNETDPAREWIRGSGYGGYFAEAFAEFMLEEETRRVWLNYYFGPRNARGVSFLAEQWDGITELCDERSHWVS